MTEEQAVAWLLLEGFRLFMDPFDDELRWVHPGDQLRYVVKTERATGARYEHPGSGIGFSHVRWHVGEFTCGAWVEKGIDEYPYYAPAVVKLLLEEAQDEP